MKPYYEDDSVRLYHGDCRNVLSGISDVATVMSVVTDPPYEVGLNTTTCDWDIWPSVETWNLIKSHCFYDAMVTFIIAPQVAHLRVPDVICSRFRLMEVGMWVWGNGRPVRQDRPKRCFDLVYFLSAGKASFNIEDGRGEYKANSITGRKGIVHKTMEIGRQFSHANRDSKYDCGAVDYHPSNVACATDSEAFGKTGYELIFSVKRMLPVGKAEFRHPTEKPLELIAQIVRLTSRAEDVILDPFAGSGTTLLAAKKLGRRAIGIERNETYCKMIVEKLRQGQLEF